MAEPSLEELKYRLALAERVCALYGALGVPMTTDRAKATTQAWLEWRRISDAPFPSDAEVLELAARRDVVLNTMLLRLRKRFGWPS